MQAIFLMAGALSLVAATDLPTKLQPDVPAPPASLVLDTEFRSPLFVDPRPAYRTLLLPDGNYLHYSSSDTLTDQRTGALVRFLPNGTRDPAFAFNRDYKNVSAAVAVSEGKVVVAASRKRYREQLFDEIVRVSPDGSIDTHFNVQVVSTAQSGLVRGLTVQPDGKILVAGYFDSFAGLPYTKIVRLLSDGTIDPSFTPPVLSGGSGIWARPRVQSDGKIMIGGNFTSVNGTATLPVLRLNPNGSRDSTFAPAGFNLGAEPIRDMVLQADGKIVLAGRFQRAPNSFCPLVRLLSNGSNDSSFTTVPDATLANFFSPRGRVLVAQADGKLVCGYSNSLYRFQPDGAWDTSFRQPIMVSTWLDPSGREVPITMDLLPDGRILVGGGFTNVDPSTEPPDAHYGVVRLTSTGAIDSTHTTSHRTGNEVAPTSAFRLPGGSVYVAFGAPYWGPGFHAPAKVGRLLPSGAIDTNFQITSLDPFGVFSAGFLARDLVRLQDGGIFVFGNARDEDWSFIPGAGKIWPDGRQDVSFYFDPGPEPSFFQPKFTSAVPLADGRVLVAAGDEPNATIWGVLTALDANGAVDPSFELPEVIRSSQVIRQFSWVYRVNAGSYPLAVQNDGKVLFCYLGADHQFHLVRLQPNGALDETFTETLIAPYDLQNPTMIIYDPARGNVLPEGGVWIATCPIRDAQVLPGGRIVLAGRFTSFNGVPARGLVRLNSNGSIDNTFSIGTGAQWIETPESDTFFPYVEAVKAQVDGKLLIAGNFEAFNSGARRGVASLNADGSIDPTAPTLPQRLKFFDFKTALARQPDGSFILSGPYAFPGETDPALIRIKSIGGVPIVGSPTLARAFLGQPFTYQIEASGQPTSYSASGFPSGFSFDPASGTISGTATAANIGSHTVTLTATNAQGTSGPVMLTITTPPAISLASAVSREWHQNQPFDINLPIADRGVESRSQTFYRTLVFSFSNQLAFAQAQISAGSATIVSTALSGQTVTVALDSVPDRQTVTLKLRNATDIHGQTLPDQSIQIGYLQGDVNGDGVVNAADVLLTRNRAGQPVSAQNFRSDVNRDGVVNGGDTVAVRGRSGNTLP